MDNAVTETQDERPIPLVQHRHGAVLAALRSSGARRVADLGCGEGALVGELLAEPAFTEVLATDVSVRARWKSRPAGCTWRPCRSARRRACGFSSPR